MWSISGTLIHLFQQTSLANSLGGEWGDMPHATTPPSHAFVMQLLTAPKDTRDSSQVPGMEGREPKVMYQRSWGFCILCCSHFWSLKQPLWGSEREGTRENHPVLFGSVLFCFLFFFPTHHKFFSSPFIVWAKCWKLRPVFHPPSTSLNTSRPGSHQEYWPIRIRRIFLC